MIVGRPSGAELRQNLPGMWSAIIPDGLVVASRYRVVSPLALGSQVPPNAHSSLVYRGVDVETGERVAIKQYRTDQPSLAGVYRNEVDVHRELADCPRIVRVLACDDDRLLIVKQYAAGILSSGATVYDNTGPSMRVVKRPVYGRQQVYALLAEIVSIVAYGEQRGLIVDHVLGGRAQCSPGGAEPNIVITESGVLAVDVCDAVRGRHRGTELRDSLIQRWLWLSRAGAAQDLPPIAFEDWPALMGEPGHRAQLTDLRRRAVARMDPDLYALADSATSADELHRGLERLARGEVMPPTKAEWAALDRHERVADLKI